MNVVGICVMIRDSRALRNFDRSLWLGENVVLTYRVCLFVCVMEAVCDPVQ